MHVISCTVYNTSGFPYFGKGVTPLPDLGCLLFIKICTKTVDLQLDYCELFFLDR